jgi:transposase
MLLESKRNRRFFSVEEKLKILRETEAPDNSISIVSRKYGIHMTQLYRWRNLTKSGQIEAMQSEEEVVRISELKALQKKIQELERILGKKTVQIEILKEAVTIARKKKLISQELLQGVDDFK